MGINARCLDSGTAEFVEKQKISRWGDNSQDTKSPEQCGPDKEWVRGAISRKQQLGAGD